MTNKNKKGIYSAQEVAKYFIYLASQEIVGDNEEREGITNLKLQKILYLAQAYYLAKFDKPLFKDSIKAWLYGPVIPSIYKKYKSRGSDAIIIDSDKDETLISFEDKKNLMEIWKVFGGYSASKLVSITHSHSPWREASDSSDKEISIKSIRDYYRPLFRR